MSRFRFSLASLLIVVTVASVWMAKTSNDARNQRAGLRRVGSNEGIVQFEPTLPAPEWLRSAIGEEYFRDEKAVDFATNQGRKRSTSDPKATNETLEHLALLDSVEILELGNNHEVTDSGMVHLTPLKNLRTVYLYRTGIRGHGLVHLEQLPRLRAVSLVNTDLDDSGAKHLGRLSCLEWLSLDNTKITDNGLADLVRASALKTLSLSNTEITDVGLTSLEQLHRLETLYVSGTRVTADGVARLQKSLPRCQITTTFALGVAPQDELLFPEGHTPTSTEINSRLMELKIDGEVRTDTSRPGNPIVSLRLFSCILSDRVVLSLIQQMPDLEKLNLRGGLVGDELLMGIGSLPIRYLSLQATRITDDGLPHLERLTKLQELILTETEVTDKCVEHLQHLNRVDSIMLDRTRVTARGSERLKQSLPNCRISW